MDCATLHPCDGQSALLYLAEKRLRQYAILPQFFDLEVLSVQSEKNLILTKAEQQLIAVILCFALDMRRSV